MFTAHLAEISVTRNEPPGSFDHAKAARQLAQLFKSIAERVVTADLLKKPNKERRANAEQKIRDSIEKEERMKTVKEFMESWNRWRLKYLGLQPTHPKTKGQLTSIERAIEFAASKDLDLNILIAVVHKAFVKRKFRPNFYLVEQQGEELYERYYTDVMADIDRESYEEDSYGR